MPATGLKFAPTYQPDTQVGAVLQNIGNALFGGPTAFQREKMQEEAALARATRGLRESELSGRQRLGAIATEYSRIVTTLPEGHPERVAFENRFAPDLAAAALASGVKPSDAADAKVLATSTPRATDADRSLSFAGAGKALVPFGAFSEKGQLSAERRQEGARTRTATAAAAAANPDKYDMVARRRAITQGQAPDSPDNRAIAIPGQAATTEMRNKDERAKNLGLDPTEMEQLDALEGTLKSFMSQSPSPSSAMRAFENAIPNGVARLQMLRQKSLDYQNSPRQRGQQRSVAPSGQTEWTVPSEQRRGVQVPAWRGEDGAWRKLEVDGKVYVTRKRDY